MRMSVIARNQIKVIRETQADRIPINKGQKYVTSAKNIPAIIDTGANCSVMSGKVASENGFEIVKSKVVITLGDNSKVRPRSPYLITRRQAAKEYA